MTLIASAMLLLAGCFGQGTRQAQRLERIYGMPMRDIITKERPKQIEHRRSAGERIDIEGAQP